MKGWLCGSKSSSLGLRFPKTETTLLLRQIITDRLFEGMRMKNRSMEWGPAMSERNKSGSEKGKMREKTKKKSTREMIQLLNPPLSERKHESRRKVLGKAGKEDRLLLCLCKRGAYVGVYSDVQDG